MLTPQIVDKPQLLVVGLEAPFISVLSPDATNAQVIGPLWDRFVHRASEIPHRAGHDMLGIITTPAPAERTHPHQLLYLAGVPVASIGDVPAGMTSRTIPAATFAAFTHRGPIQTIGQTCDQIYRVWLPQSAWQHAGLAEIELYDERFCAGGDDAEMEIWVSVRPKACG